MTIVCVILMMLDKLENNLQDKLQSTRLNKLQNTEHVHNDVDVDDIDDVVLIFDETQQWLYQLSPLQVFLLLTNG